MSSRNYLLSASILSSDYSELRELTRQRRATVVEVGEAVGMVPIPWLACFGSADLRPCVIDWGGGKVCIDVPCVGVEEASRNLLSAVGLFNLVAEDELLAKEYWLRAIGQLLSLQLPFVTIDVRQLLMGVEPGEFNSAIRASLSRGPECFEAMCKVFFSYRPGVKPYRCADLAQAQELSDEDRLANSLIVDAAIRPPSAVSFWGERWRTDLRRQSLGLGGKPAGQT